MRHEDKKIKVIYFLTAAIDRLRGTAYEADLERLRRKYIYKDISAYELKEDLRYLKDIKDILESIRFQ